MIFKRKLYNELIEWKQRSNGKTALMIEGARRVGKTTLVKTFADNEYKSWVYIDFSAANKDILNLFSDLSDLDSFYRDLQVISKKEFFERNTALIFDEIQNFKRARESIKHLVADGRYDIIETGSLISIKKNIDGIVIPSEEECYELHPLSFEEFLLAKGNNTFRLLEYNFEKGKPLNEATHNSMMREYRDYIAVGGMPQAVEAYVNGKSFQDIDRIKRAIIRLYADDFMKIDPTGITGDYFRMIPSELASESIRYRVNGRIERNIGKITNMAESKTVQLCFHVNDPHIGMSGNLNRTFFKIFLEDTGLFVTLCFSDNKFSDNVIYERLVKGRLPANLGYVYENAVCQALVSSGHIPRYHTFEKPDGKHHYEIDFIISKGLKIVPIEVKSSSEKSHKSLDEYLAKHHNDTPEAFVICTKNLRKEGNITYLPIYMTEFL